jgi:hypothetical protein
MGIASTMTHAPSGTSAWLIYNDGNLRITQAGWNNPSQYPVRVSIFENGALTHETLLSTGAGTQNVAGSYRLVQVTDEYGSYLTLPAGVSVQMRWPG